MRNLLYITLILGLLSSCSNFKENMGLVKNQPDEYQIITNPSLSVPPDFNVYSPEELEAQKTKDAKVNHGNFSKGKNSILQNMNQ